jgi:hypothetical protein
VFNSILLVCTDILQLNDMLLPELLDVADGLRIEDAKKAGQARTDLQDFRQTSSYR